MSLIIACALAACEPRSSSSNSVAPLASAASEASTPTQDAAPDPIDADVILDAAPSIPPAMTARLRARANEVLAALKTRDTNALAALAHPTKGVRFSPYPYVDTKADVTLSRAQIRSALTDTRVRHWGDADGSGDPIRLTFAAYFKRFVWSHDFSKAPEVNVDKGESSGNTVDNIAEAYSGAHFVELYYPTFSPKYQGMDWESLRVVFEDAQSDDGGTTLWLVGIIHGQWTI